MTPLLGIGSAQDSPTVGCWGLSHQLESQPSLTHWLTSRGGVGTWLITAQHLTPPDASRASSVCCSSTPLRDGQIPKGSWERDKGVLRFQVPSKSGGGKIFEEEEENLS